MSRQKQIEFSNLVVQKCLVLGLLFLWIHVDGSLGPCHSKSITLFYFVTSRLTFGVEHANVVSAPTKIS